MTSKLLYEKIPKKILNSCFKFVFLTKKFKERWPCVTFLKLFINVMIRNIKIHNILHIIIISKSMDLINVLIKKKL